MTVDESNLEVPADDGLLYRQSGEVGTALCVERGICDVEVAADEMEFWSDGVQVGYDCGRCEVPQEED